MKNLSLLTYTHSKASDVHQPYFDSVKKYFKIDNHVVLSDKIVDNNDIVMAIYDNGENYYQHMLNGLNKVKTDYVIYSQEDYILFNQVDIKRINELISILDSDKNISFIRLIYSGIDFNLVDYDDNLIYLKSDHEYYFSTQITIWRKQDLIDLFTKSKVETIWDEPKNSSHLLELGKIGLCVKDKGEKVGGHYNSSIYPYIATAVVKGKWNYSEYKNHLDFIFTDYNIDKNIRGIR